MPFATAWIFETRILRSCVTSGEGVVLSTLGVVVDSEDGVVVLPTFGVVDSARVVVSDAGVVDLTDPVVVSDAGGEVLSSRLVETCGVVVISGRGVGLGRRETMTVVLRLSDSFFSRRMWMNFLCSRYRLQRLWISTAAKFCILLFVQRTRSS